MALPVSSIVVSIIIAIEHLIKAVNALQESSKKNRVAFEVVSKELIGVKSLLETLKTALDREVSERKEKDVALELRLSTLQSALDQGKRLMYWAFGIALIVGGSSWIYIFFHRGISR